MVTMDQFSIASALLSTHGGVPEIAWDVAGEILAEGADLREVFVKVSTNGYEARIQAHEDALAR